MSYRGLSQNWHVWRAVLQYTHLIWHRHVRLISRVVNKAHQRLCRQHINNMSTMQLTMKIGPPRTKCFGNCSLIYSDSCYRTTKHETNLFKCEDCEDYFCFDDTMSCIECDLQICRSCYFECWVCHPSKCVDNHIDIGLCCICVDKIPANVVYG